MSWQRVGPVAEITSRGVVFKKPPRQLAVFRVDDRFYAIDNRCPHEGYPLAEGTVDDECVLTCNWHNWKFRLRDGECLLGGDHVRSYATDVRDEELWVDLSPPPPDVQRAEILRGLHRAHIDRDYGRICREISRLHFCGLEPLEAVIQAIRWSHDRLEFGTQHSYAAAADWLQWYGEFTDWHRRLICLAECVDHMAFDSQRHPQYSYAETNVEYCESAFVDSVEQEDRLRAEGLVHNAIRAGANWSDLESGFARAALAHFNDFGHSLIYVVKTGQLIERLDTDGVAEAGGGGAQQTLMTLALPLARHLCYTTREDLIPEFRAYGQGLATLRGAESVNAGSPAAEELFGATTRNAVAFVASHFDPDHVMTIYDQLLAAIARNLLHFDLRFDQSTDGKVTENIGWLHLTHGITFANAVRHICLRYSDLWPRGLLQMACMLGRNADFLDRDIDESKWTIEGEAESTEFLQSERERTLDHGFRDPIFSAHLVKTITAVEDELPHASATCRRYLLAGLNRFLHSPIKQKHASRLAHQAIDLVQRDFRA